MRALPTRFHARAGRHGRVNMGCQGLRMVGMFMILGNQVPKAGIWKRLLLARREEATGLVLAFSMGVVFAKSKKTANNNT